MRCEIVLQRSCYARTCVNMERSSAVAATNYRVDAGYCFRTLSTVFRHRKAPTRRLPRVLDIESCRLSRRSTNDAKLRSNSFLRFTADVTSDEKKNRRGGSRYWLNCRTKQNKPPAKCSNAVSQHVTQVCKLTSSLHITHRESGIVKH